MSRYLKGKNNRSLSIRLARVLGVLWIAILLVYYYFSLTFPLFATPYATVLKDRQGNVLSAAIADDGQWRFPPADSVSEKFCQAILS